MIQVSYISAATSELSADEIFSIIEASSHNNLRDDLTGFCSIRTAGSSKWWKDPKTP